MRILLNGKTRKGKNKIHEADSPVSWIILDQRESVSFSPKSGPWIFIRPNNDIQGKERWVALTNDRDFDVTLTQIEF